MSYYLMFLISAKWLYFSLLYCNVILKQSLFVATEYLIRSHVVGCFYCPSLTHLAKICATLLHMDKVIKVQLEMLKYFQNCTLLKKEMIVVCITENGRLFTIRLSFQRVMYVTNFVLFLVDGCGEWAQRL